MIFLWISLWNSLILSPRIAFSIILFWDMKKRRGRRRKKGVRRKKSKIKVLKDGTMIEVLTREDIQSRMREYVRMKFSLRTVLNIMGRHFDEVIWNEVNMDKTVIEIDPIPGGLNHEEWCVENRKRKRKEEEIERRKTNEKEVFRTNVFSSFNTSLENLERKKKQKEKDAGKKKGKKKKGVKGKKKKKGKRKKKRRNPKNFF